MEVFQMKNFTKIIVVTLLLFSFSTILSAQAATLSDFNSVKNTEILSDDGYQVIDESLKNIPQCIPDLYNRELATIEFTSGILAGEDNVMGLYYQNSSDIFIKYRESLLSDPNLNLGVSLPHELGHFIYEKTRLYWSESAKKQITSSYNYWKKYSLACYNEHETFATLYSWYVNNDGCLTSDEIKMMEEIHEVCNELAEKK